MEAIPFDLYEFVERLRQEDWIESIHIFGSRRFIDNGSYGSDIDLLLVPTTGRQVPISEVRSVVSAERYVDAFLLKGNVATSAANETSIQLVHDDFQETLRSVPLWNREKGWLSGQDYRTLNIIPDRNPAMTLAPMGAKPVLLLCALPKEYEAVRTRLDVGKEPSSPLLPRYFQTYIKTKSGRQRLAVAVLIGTGSIAAAISTARILNYFENSCLAILVGIAGGIKEVGSQLCDVLVPSAVVDIEAGKRTPEGKLSSGIIPPLADLHGALSSWAGQKEWASKWKQEINGVQLTPKVNSDCTLACSAAVIADSELAKSLKERHRKVSGIEMESLGVVLACQGRVPLLVAKSISDWANDEKSDDVHSRCCDLIADYVISALQDEVI